MPDFPNAAAGTRRSPLHILLAIVIAMIAAALLGGIRVHLTLTHLSITALEIGATWIVFSLYLRWRPNPRLTEMLNYVVLWLVFSTAAAALTYVAAACALPLWDVTFRAMDHSVGFDTLRWTALLQSYPSVFALLRFDYFTTVIQISVTVLWLAHTRTAGRNAQFLGAAMIGLLLTTILATLLPALGPAPNDNPSILGQHDIDDIIVMRQGQPVIRAVNELQGIIQFPSYHTFLAILITWANRSLVTFWPFACVNGLMLFAIPAVGNHYAVDLVGGAAVAAMAIVGAGWLFPAEPADWSQ